MLAALTAAAGTALLSAFTGDSGAGGIKGLVPAPAAGDAAAGKFVKADGTFAVPSAGTAMQSKLLSATRDMTAASGSVSYTGVGFQPTAIIALAGIPTTMEWSVGMADSAVGERVFAVEGTTLAVSANATQLIRILDSGAANDQIAALTSYDADGFTLSWTKVGSPTGTATLYFLCLR